MAERHLRGFCDLKGDYAHLLDIDDPRTSWDEEACESFNEKHKQVIERGMVPYCLKVCGNCEYFTVGEVELYAGVCGVSLAESNTVSEW